MKKFIYVLLSAALITGLYACSNDKHPDVNIELQTLWDTVESTLGENLGSMDTITDESLKNVYGIDASDLEQYVAKIPMMNVQASEFFMAEVKEGKMDTVKTALENRAKVLDEQWAMYLPDQHELVKNYSVIEKGRFIFFIIHSEKDKVVAAIEDAFK